MCMAGLLVCVPVLVVVRGVEGLSEGRVVCQAVVFVTCLAAAVTPITTT
jgi:hypothetical protein